MQTQGSRTAVYTRISRDVSGEGLGVERQREDCEALADRLGATIVDRYEDNDRSAYSGRTRPEYERLLFDIEHGRVDTVICWNADRLHRQTKELERYMELCLPRGVVTHTVRAGVVDLTTANGRMVAKMLGAVSQQESELKGERIQRQKQQAAKSGKYLGGRVPWGWKKADTWTDGNGRERGGTIVVDEVAASVIRSGTEAIAAGRSLGAVTRDWADAGAVSLAGGTFTLTQVRRILLRERNAGLMIFHGEVVSDGWPAIVDLATFRKCEAALKDPSKPRQSEAKFRYLLSGILRCHCGRYMTGFGAEGHRRSYRCRVHQERQKYQPGHASRAMASLDDYVLRVVAAHLGREDYKAAVIAAMQEIHDTQVPQRTEDVAALVDRKHSLARMFAQGVIAESQLVEGTREIESKLAELTRSTSAANGSRAVNTLMLNDDPARTFLEGDVDVQREVLRALFDLQLNEMGGQSRGKFAPESVTITRKGATA